jgi:hypothetical protein
MQRRKFVKAAGVTTVGLATAGCLGGDADGSTGTDTEQPTETATEQPAGGNGTTTSDDTGDLDVEGSIGDTSENLEVTNQELYEKNGEVGVRGTVENTGDKPYESVEAEVVVHDDKGDVLYEFIDEKEEAQNQYLEAGSTWQFDVIFEEAKMSQVTEYTVNVEGDVAQTGSDEGTATEEWDIDGSIGDTPETLEVTSQKLQRSGETAQVTGTVENTGNEAVESVGVEVTLYDQNDDEIDILNRRLEEDTDTAEIPAGGTWDFTVDFDDVDMEKISRYVIDLETGPV